MRASAAPPDLLCWLPGPIATPEHRALATSRTVADLRRRAARRLTRHPETWIAVAHDLGIAADPLYSPGEGRGRLYLDDTRDQWVILYNVAYSRVQQAQTLVHELAHWYFHQMLGEWLCDEPIVYYYEGDVLEEHHKLARDVERLVVQVWDEVVPAVGLFEEKTNG